FSGHVGHEGGTYVSTTASIEATSALPLLDSLPLASRDPLLVPLLEPVLDPSPLELLGPPLELELLPLIDASPPLLPVAPSPEYGDDVCNGSPGWAAQAGTAEPAAATRAMMDLALPRMRTLALYVVPAKVGSSSFLSRGLCRGFTNQDWSFRRATRASAAR